MVFTTAGYIIAPSSQKVTNPTVTFLSAETDHSSIEFRDSASAKAGTRHVGWPMSSIVDSLG